MDLHGNNPKIEKNMETIKFCLKTLFVLLVISCSKGDTESENEIYPIELSRRIMRVDHIKTTDEVDIISGNGDYKIIEIQLGYNANEEINKKLENIPLENIFKIFVEGNKIIVKRILLEDLPISALFVLVDAKGIRKTCVVENPNMVGIHDFYD